MRTPTELREAAGLTQAKLADLLQVEQSTVARWERGERGVGVKYLALLSVHLKADEPMVRAAFDTARRDYLARTGASTPAAEEPPQGLASGLVQVDHTEFVAVPRYDAALSAGPGSILEERPEALGFQLIERQWLRVVTRASPPALAILRVDGDSMEKTLHDGDWVLVDRTQRRINRSGIYALQVGDIAWVKRVELDLAEKKVQIISDNPRYGVQRLHEEELSIIGRVVWIVGRRV